MPLPGSVAVVFAVIVLIVVVSIVVVLFVVVLVIVVLVVVVLIDIVSVVIFLVVIFLVVIFLVVNFLDVFFYIIKLKVITYYEWLADPNRHPDVLCMYYILLVRSVGILTFQGHIRKILQKENSMITSLLERLVTLQIGARNTI